jgi:hypothetical protein
MQMNVQNKKTFYRALQGLSFFIPCAMNEDNEITLRLLMNGSGQQFVPAFFSKNSKIGDFPANELVEFAFPKLRNIFIDLPNEICGLVIEPFEKNILVNREGLREYDSETQGMTVARHDHNGGTMLSIPRNLPKGLKEAVSEFCRSQIGVNTAWILLAQGDEEKIPHLMFAVDFYGSKLTLFPKLAGIIKPYMVPGQQFELIEKVPGNASGKTPDQKLLRDAMVYSRHENLPS